jgi:hypothetical protein
MDCPFGIPKTEQTLPVSSALFAPEIVRDGLHPVNLCPFFVFLSEFLAVVPILPVLAEFC